MTNKQTAQFLMELMEHKGWELMVSLLASIAEAQYPDPKSLEYKYNPWKQIEKDYTYARGGTEVVKKFLVEMGNQEHIYKKIAEKEEGNEPDYRI